MVLSVRLCKPKLFNGLLERDVVALNHVVVFLLKVLQCLVNVLVHRKQRLLCAAVQATKAAELLLTDAPYQSPKTAPLFSSLRS